ncbi:MAG TPA: Ig-like domain repeat protein, partial [Symbiobacteriaceae bacterium]|nr:Ig-like domain repeat protein [Symbiobacteriaceae bacterium]
MTQLAERFGWAARVVSAGFIGALALAAILFLGTPVAQASDFLVTTTMDSVDNNLGDSICANALGQCSLRAAIQNANKNPDADTIRLKPGTYTISLAGGGEDNAATGDIDILGAVSMIGVLADGVTENPDASQAIIDGAQVDRIFSVGPYGTSASFNATFKNLTLRNGRNTTSGDAYGGAMDSGSSGSTLITIDNLIFEDNYATQDGGAIYMDGGTNRRIEIKNTIFRRNSVTNGSGGAVQFSLGVQYDIYDSAFESNTAQFGSAISVGAAATGGYVPTINRTTFSGNTANTSGTVYLTGPTAINNSTISGNSAAQRAGGIRHGGTAGQMLTLRHVTVTGNTAGTAGSGVEVSMVNTTLEMHNSIIAGNTGGGAELIGTGAGTGTALISASSTNNLVGNGSNLTNGVNGNKTGIANPGLGTLTTDPGSKGKIHIPVKGGLAHNAGNNAQTGGLTTDQRGQTRVVGTVDIGAVEVQLTPTTSTLSSSANPSTVGQSVTFTATVTGAGGTPSGTVTFKDGATTIGTATLSAGTATFTTSALSAGTHSISAAYGGDADFASSTSATLTQTVNKATTTTAVNSSVNPAVYGQTVTLTANVTSGYAGTISGTVTFMDGAATLGTGTLSGGSATWTGTLAVGSHAITAVYSGDGTYNGSTGSGLTQTVNKAATATGLTSSKNPSLYNQNVLFTASITVTAPGAGTPTGTVTFKDGATVLGTPQPVSGGYATLFISDLAPGTHSITAVYNGDGNLATSTSSAVSQVVESATTSTTVTTSASPSPLGDTVTFTATVTDSIGDLTPTGTVTFKNGGTTLGTGTLNGSAQATFSTTSLPIGTYTITAEYAGDTTFLASSGTVSQEITKGVTASTVSVSDTTPVYGQSVTLTATVIAAVPANGTPAGTVTFTMDGTELGTATLSGAGTATLATPALTVGNRSITTAYSGDATFAASSSAPYALTVAKSPTSTAISAAPNPSEFGQSVTFTATVNVAGDGAGTVTGSVLFMEESTTLGTVPLTGNTATYTISSLSPGPAHKITAHYTGDANFDASASGEASQVVNPAVSTTVLTSSKSTSAYGESVRLTATITSAFGSPADGTVTFYAGSTPVGTAAVVAGAAILDKTDLPVGTYDLKATFSGNATATSDESDPVSQTVTKAAATADLDVTPLTASVYGEWVTFVAWVTPAHTGVPTGSITFMDGDTVLGVEPLDGSAMASFVTADLPVGSHQFKAVYGGDGNFVGAASSVAAFTVNAASTDVTLVTSPNPTKYGDAVTFTATVTVEAPGTGTPGGEVIFKEGATELGRATLAGGTASFSTTSLSVGSHSVTAEYAGSTSFAGSATAAAVTQVVNKGLTTTAIAGLPNPSVYGQTVTLKATVTANTAGTGTPAGTVKFMSGAAELGQATLNGSGVAELTHVFNLVGTTSVEAVYQGDDSRFAPSTSTALSQVVNPAATSTALAVDLSNPSYGDNVTLTATVTATAPGGGTPTGTVTFMDGATSLGTKSLVGGSASLTLNTLGAGAHSLTAVYGGSGDHVASTSVAASMTVAKATLTATLTSSYNPSVYGQGMDFTATLTPTGGVAAAPAGVYDLMINGTAAVTDNPIGWDANIARSAPAEGVGDYEIYFVFKGDANYLPATSNTITQTIVKANTTTVASAIAATVYGQPMTFTATINPVAPSVWRPDGDVQILNGTEVLGQGTMYGIDSDTAEVQVTVSTLPVGTHTLTVKYLGSTNFNGSSTTISHTVNKAGSAVTLASSDTTSNFGETITLTATASATGAGSGTPAGEVIFNRIEGGVAVEELGRAPLVGGTASIDIATLSVGNHQIRAEYSGNASFLASQSDPMSQTVAPATTTTTLTVDDATPVYSQAVTFTATVAPTVAAGIPGGKVTFKEGATILAADVTLDAAGKAQFTTSALSLGSHNITVSYAGDANYAASDSVAVTVTVDSSPTTTTLSSDSATNTTTFGESITLTATLTSTGGGTPDGTVTFMDGATALGTVNLVGGTASLTTAALGGGVHTLTAVYDGTGNYVTSTSATLTHTVNRATVTPVITSLITAPAFGQNARFSIAVTPDGPATATPTGAFAVLVNGTPQPDGTLSGGVAEVEVSGLIVGTHTIGLSYKGDANYAPSNAATISVQVQKADATVTLSQNLATTVYGQSVTFTAEVTAKSPSQAQPSGKVQFYRSDIMLAEVSLTAQSATSATAALTTNSLAEGLATMRAVYTGDDGFVTKTSADLSHTVNKADTSVTVVSSKNPSKYGENVTLTATVTAVSPGSGTPSGTVTFRSGLTVIGTGTLSGGIATMETTALDATSHTITASYSGDGSFNSNAPGTLSQVVEPGITSTAVTTDVASPVWGQPVTFTATVTPAIASGIPGGTVTFKEGATVLAADVVLDASGRAQFTTDALTVGSHTITAVYAGAGNYAGSTSDGFSKTIGKASAQAILIIAPSPSDFGEDITLTAEVSALAPGAGLPTGTVTFKDGDTAIATGVALNGSGVAQYTVAAGLATGTHTITVVYSGDGHFTAATSSGLTHEVQTAPGSLSAANLSASYGGTATLTATLLPPAAGKEIQFTVAGTNIGSAVTNAAGVATKTYQPFLTAGPHTVAVSFAGDADIAANDATGTLTVTQATGTVTVAAQTGIYRSNVTLEATLAPVAANRTITFSVNGTAVGSGTTDATGKATYTYFITAPVGSATIDAAFAGDAEVAAATGTGTLTVSKATGVMVADDVTDILRRTVTLRAVLAPAEAGLTVTFKV